MAGVLKDPVHCPQCLLLANRGKCSDWPSNDFRAYSDCALQACPVLQTYGAEPAGDGACDDNLYEGGIQFPMFLFTPKVLSLQ